MARIGYIRVSTEDQNTARQEIQMQDLDKLYIEKVSGKSTQRPELKKMMDYIREGDTIVVESISRFARNTKDLLSLVEELTQKGVAFVSLKESIDTATPQGQFMLTVFGAMAQLERDCILQRQREGIAIAKAEGKYKGRQPIAVDEETFKRECSLWRSGQITATEAMKRLNLKPNTFYRRVKEMGL
ncbi:recombinase family protein [Massiliimalia timonensis]|uniref:recombinase family protein n=1 Tax=Massiliimalia timonensis TaxID=1987501 RepID=UPI0018A0CAD3|nr:recombinase family protein [Massiliimalia timonensis]